MNYARVRQVSEKKIKEKREALAKLNGKERTRAEQMLMKQAEDEVRNEEEGQEEDQEGQVLEVATKKRGRKPKAE